FTVDGCRGLDLELGADEALEVVGGAEAALESRARDLEEVPPTRHDVGPVELGADAPGGGGQGLEVDVLIPLVGRAVGEDHQTAAPELHVEQLEAEGGEEGRHELTHVVGDTHGLLLPSRLTGCGRRVALRVRQRQRRGPEPTPCEQSSFGGAGTERSSAKSIAVVHISRSACDPLPGGWRPGPRPRGRPPRRRAWRSSPARPAGRRSGTAPRRPRPIPGRPWRQPPELLRLPEPTR